MILFRFVLFSSTQTQLRLYGAKTRKMILANLGCYKLEATPGVKTTSPAGAKDAYTPVIQIYLPPMITQG
jgi:hypothetical protein